MWVKQIQIQKKPKHRKSQFDHKLTIYLTKRHVNLNFEFLHPQGPFSQIVSHIYIYCSLKTASINLTIISLNVYSVNDIFCNLQTWERTYAVLVIGLYELLGNPTT